MAESQTAIPGPFLDAQDAAQYLATSTDRIHGLVRDGNLRAQYEARRMLFRREDLDACVTREGVVR